MNRIVARLGAAVCLLFCIAALFACAKIPAGPDRSGGVLTDTEKEETTALPQNIYIRIGDAVLAAELADNSSARALTKLLPLTITMQDYGSFEKVGPLGANLPRNDEPITTSAGDLILYQGNQFVIYYDTNHWNFTRIGKIVGVSAKQLKDLLGNGDVTVTLSLTKA